MELVKAIFFVVVISLFFLTALSMPRLFNVYRICERGIRIKLLGIITHTRIWWTEIASVEVVALGDMPLLQHSIPAYQFSTKRVVIHLRKGLVRNVVLPVSLRDLLGLDPKQAFQVSGCLLTPMGSLDCPAQDPRAASDLGTLAAVAIGGIYDAAARLGALEPAAEEGLTPVIGRLADTAKYAGREGFETVNPLG